MWGGGSEEQMTTRRDRQGGQMNTPLEIRVQPRGRRTAGGLIPLLLFGEWRFTKVIHDLLNMMWEKVFRFYSFLLEVFAADWEFLLAFDLVAEAMGEICSSFVGPSALSAHKVRSGFFYVSTEKPTGTTLLARNIYFIGGTVAVPQKCRLAQIGKTGFIWSFSLFLWYLDLRD